MIIQQMLHGYDGGHRLLTSSINLSTKCLDKATEMSDWNEFSAQGDDAHSYITTYPLGDDIHYVIARTWYANEMSRPGCVWTHSLVVSYDDLYLMDFRSLYSLFKRPQVGEYSSYSIPIELDSIYQKQIEIERDTLYVLLTGLLKEDSQMVLPYIGDAVKTQIICLTLLQLLPEFFLRKVTLCSGTANIIVYEGKAANLQFITHSYNKAPSYKKNEIIEVIKYVDDFYTEGAYLYKFIKGFSQDIGADYALFRKYVNLFYVFANIKKNDYQSIFSFFQSLYAIFPKASSGELLKNKVLSKELFGEDENLVLRSLMYISSLESFNAESIQYYDRLMALYKNNQDECIEEISYLLDYHSYNDLGEEFLQTAITWLDDNHIEPIIRRGIQNSTILRLITKWLECQYSIDDITILNQITTVSPKLFYDSCSSSLKVIECLARSRYDGFTYCIWLFRLSDCVNSKYERNLLFAKSYPIIYKWTESGDMSDSVWSTISSILPKLSIFQLWDKCKALRKHKENMINSGQLSTDYEKVLKKCEMEYKGDSKNTLPLTSKVNKTIVANDFPFLEKEIELINKKFCESGWMTVATDRTFCALVDDKHLDEALKHDSWDLRPDEYSSRIDEDSHSFLRLRKNPVEGFLPFVVIIPAKGVHNEERAVCDDFRLIYNLFREQKAKDQVAYVQVDESGESEDEIVLISGCEVKVKAKYIKEYLAINELNLIIFYDFINQSDKTYSELGLTPRNNEYVSYPDTCFSYCNIQDSGLTSSKSGAFLMGKCVVRHNKDNIKFLWGGHENDYEEFIIGSTDDGDDVLWTCEENMLSSGFETYSTLPSALTPVFFKSSVLDKYKLNPGKYQIMDGAISGPEWMIRVDNDRTDGHIVAVLKDMGKVPVSVQRYWKQFNVAPPQGATLSNTTISRWFGGQTCDPSEAPDLRFKSTFNNLNKIWRKKYGWKLFTALTSKDKHFFDGIQCMTESENDKDFDDLILAITKTVIDSLNEKQIVSHIDASKSEVNEYLTKNKIESIKDIKGGISKFELFLISEGIDGTFIINHLRKIQDLRSCSVAHRKSSNPDKRTKECYDYFGLNSTTEQNCINSLLNNLSDYFDDLLLNIPF